MLSARLSDDLTARHKVRRIPLRTRDTVRIMRGEFADLVGKVEKAEYSTGRIFVEGMTREKPAADSSKLPVDSSKVLITNLTLSHTWRIGLLSAQSQMAAA